MKAYTDLPQSKKLAEILPIESADAYWFKGFPCQPYMVYTKGTPNPGEHIPCWSLAALFNHLREIDFFPNIEVDEHEVTMSVFYYNDEEVGIIHPVHDIRVKEDTFIDACYKLILKLHEQKVL